MMNARCLFTDVGDMSRGFGARMRAGPFGDGLQFLSGAPGQPVRQPLGRQGGLRLQPGGLRVAQEARVGGLMIIDGMRERHEQRSHARRRHLGHRHGARAADEQVGIAQRAGHVLDERAAVGLHARLGVGLLQRGQMLFAGLMDDRRTAIRRHAGQRLRHGGVQRLRAQAAAHDQQAQCAGARAIALRRIGQRAQVGAHRIAQRFALGNTPGNR